MTWNSILDREHRNIRQVPVIDYDLDQKTFSFDGEAVDVPRESREKIRFEISRVPVTLTFPCFPPSQEDPPAKQRDFESSLGSREPDIGNL